MVLSAPAEATSTTANGLPPVLEVQNLSCVIETAQGPARLVNDVSFTLGHGDTLGIVGESGSGKTMLVRTIVGIGPKGARVSGRVLLHGEDLLALPPKERRRRTGANIGMIFQNPMTSLNPVVPIGRQITEALRFHRGLSKADARERALELLEQVGISEPRTRLKQYAYQMSGGMRQRIIIAAALACDPDVLIADEATTALDVTVQKQILDLIEEIQAVRNMAVAIISHDMGVVAGRADKVAVMYSSKVVETGATKDVFLRHRHQYTSALLKSIPEIGDEIHSKMATIPGSPPRPSDTTPGCRFAPRCPAAIDECRIVDPAPTVSEDASSHWFRCHVPTPLPDPSLRSGGVKEEAHVQSGGES